MPKSTDEPATGSVGPGAGAESDDLLRLRELKVEFALHDERVPVLHGVTFAVKEGACVALVGESGCGKSVTAQAVMGILPEAARITGGEILFREQPGGGLVDLARLPRNGRRMRAVRGGRISIVFQEPGASLSPLHSVGDQVSEALFLHRDVGRREGMRITVDMLRLVGFPEPERALRMYPFELSGGLRQRAMIAMALICRPALLVADEPTTALDVTIQAQILKLIDDLRAELGMAVLIITHDLGVVANLAEEVAVMYRGRIVESGGVEDIIEHPRHPYLKALLRAVPHFEVKSGERLQPIREIRAEPARLLTTPARGEAGRPLLTVRGLSKSFTMRKSGWFATTETATRTAVNDVSLTVRRAECFGLVGESGCGKTTLSKMLMRALDPDAGEIDYEVDGRTVDVLGLEGEALKAFRRRMQFVFQDPFGSLSPRMTVFDILREPLVVHGYGDRAYQREMATELLRLVGLDPRFLKRYPHSFSGGQRQRLGIARALALGPEFLICDEPVSALDVSIQAQVLNLLKQLQEQLSLTYLFISHNLAVVHYIAERIAVMCQGHIVEVAPREELFRRPVHPYTKALIAAIPYPDLDHPLDLDELMQGRASEPANWPSPFAIREGAATEFVTVGRDHQVRATAGTSAQHLKGRAA